MSASWTRPRPTASEVAQILTSRALPNPTGQGLATFLATDGPERFARVGSLFLQRDIACGDVEVVDL